MIDDKCNRSEVVQGPVAGDSVDESDVNDPLTRYTARKFVQV